ncbi:hypothetical protein RD792_003318 [Penstemon davidsonii]|uniref:Protein-serine/threonine phosphatase n=1 Tax=Penstemon davidsonii TaxID=160366 RepID=A0ABR0DTF8_9LAMI|nr:hypothetical protein RD792_003318 [Penstemon davidsonii]
MKYGEFALLIVLLGSALFANFPVAGESLTCLTVYREGGAPAVFQSPKCPRWSHSNFKSNPDRPATCQSAKLQGRRKSQEDRTLCACDLSIPFPGPKGVKEVKVGIMAVFDGHNGAEASEMASELLLEYFVLHTYFLLDTTYSILSRKMIGRLPDKGGDGRTFDKWNDGHEVLDLGRFKVTLSAILDGSFPFEILREALLRAIYDIDTAFSKDASRYNLSSGTTATVVLLADNQILVANVGDSKAFLCSEAYQSPSEAKATVFRLVRQGRTNGASSSLKEYYRLKSEASKGWMFLIAKELTNDHHPDRVDEKSRVESAGGHISKWGGVARVNGQLAVSRAIGDIHFKSYGVISVPEVTDWQHLTANDSYVIAASDGVFEKLSPQDICDMLWEPLSHLTMSPELNSSCSYSLADCIVHNAFERGSMDNLAAVMLPVRASGSFEASLKDRSYKPRKIDYSALGNERHFYENSVAILVFLADKNTSLLMELRSPPDVAKFDRLLVEGKHKNSSCFYLSENLDVNDDYTFWIHKDDHESMSDLAYALTGGPLDSYHDQHICTHFGMYIDEDNDQCMNSDGFARFVGLLQSIPFHSTSQNEHMPSDTRYILKKKFDRGAFGEVWLAFNWNCSQVVSGCCKQVERGLSAYLSGLREKYFGEVFLNASNFLRGSLYSGSSDLFSEMSQSKLQHGFKNVNRSVDQEIEEPLSPDDMMFKERRQHGAALEEGLDHIARYIESFESRSNEIWLVFRHEGVSLSKLLYTAEEVVNDSDKERNEHEKRVQILRPSKWWHWLKTTEAGQEEFRNIIRQLLMALKSCHDRNVTHRDIKPENMVICFEDHDSGSCLSGSPNGDKSYTTKMRIIDFGSAVNDFTVKHLYGSVGPSSAEQTSEYAPPEAFLNASWYRGPSSVTTKYDSWSVGVVIMELILGSPNVFQINSITQVLLDQHLKGWNDSLKELAYKLRALMELCILIPGISSKLRQNWGTNGQGFVTPVPWKCSEEYFSHQIKSRDPLKLGFPNVWALRLVRDLLQWDPEDRLGVDDALKHPYFSGASF